MELKTGLAEHVGHAARRFEAASPSSCFHALLMMLQPLTAKKSLLPQKKKKSPTVITVHGSSRLDTRACVYSELMGLYR